MATELPEEMPEVYKQFYRNLQKRDREEDEDWRDRINREETQKRIGELKEKQREYSRTDSNYHRIQNQIDELENPWINFNT